MVYYIFAYEDKKGKIKNYLVGLYINSNERVNSLSSSPNKSLEKVLEHFKIMHKNKKLEYNLPEDIYQLILKSYTPSIYIRRLNQDEIEVLKNYI